VSAPREVWVLVDEQGAAFVLDDGHDAVKAALKFPMDRRPTVHRYALATPPAVREGVVGNAPERLRLIPVTYVDGGWVWDDCVKVEPTTIPYATAVEYVRRDIATPPAVSEPFEEIEELPAVLPAQNSATQTEQDTEATVWVHAETRAALRLAVATMEDRAGQSPELTFLDALIARCRVAPEVGNG
jgi:hypothetical protein